MYYLEQAIMELQDKKGDNYTPTLEELRLVIVRADELKSQHDIDRQSY